MAKRSTIGKDPFADAKADFPLAPEMPETNVVALGRAAAGREPPAQAAVAPDPANGAARPEAEPAITIVRIEDGAVRRAVGGRLEIFGGDLGIGAATIWRHGEERRIGFVAPNGRFVDLAQELDVAQSWQDRTEHRVLSTLGWAWVIGSIGGIVGLMAGGGLRLLEPRRMIMQLRLADGGKLVVRTDSVTASGLRALASRAAAAPRAPSFLGELATRFHRAPVTA